MELSVHDKFKVAVWGGSALQTYRKTGHLACGICDDLQVEEHISKRTADFRISCVIQDTSQSIKYYT